MQTLKLRFLFLTVKAVPFAAGADIKEMQPQSFHSMYDSNFFAGLGPLCSLS